MDRTDKERLEFVCRKLNPFFEVGFYMTGNEEDYGIDLGCSGYTEEGTVFDIPYEVKTITNKFTNEYLSKVAGRNPKCRYCVTADTVEELESCTDMPDWLKADTPIHILNSTDKYGRPNGKWHRLLEANGGLIYVRKGEILVYTPNALKKAFLGYIWIKCTHTTEFEDRKMGWERKAAIDMTKWSYRIKCEVPEEFL